MPKPSAKYYKELPNKIGDVLSPEQFKVRVEKEGEQYRARAGTVT